MRRPLRDLVREFHEVPGSGQRVAEYPTAPEPELARHRGRLIEEEFKEAMAELEKFMRGGLSPEKEREALAALLGELADIIYVVEGTAVSMGLPLEEAYVAVHRANMRKVWPDGTMRTNERGKVIKPPGWYGTDMGEFIPPVIEGEAVE